IIPEISRFRIENIKITVVFHEDFFFLNSRTDSTIPKIESKKTGTAQTSRITLAISAESDSGKIKTEITMLAVIMTASISEIRNESVSRVNLCFEFNLFFSFPIAAHK
ncbi:MAG: hypothetical protein IJ257_03285, partial [Treponema sp.]|nr:hypothetical protein [Treponema sp.]